jgi:hypothetical protein
MTTRSRMPRILIGLFVTLALAAAAGCATKPPSVPSAQPPSDSGDGQFGEVGATPTATEEPTEPPPPDPSPTNTGPGIILTINPNIVQILLWPSPADCVNYDPNAATIVTLLAVPPATGTYQVRSGATVLMNFKRLVDAQEGLKVAKSYQQHCFIGRGNSRPNPESYTLHYWRNPVQNPPGIPNPDCFSHTSAGLFIEDLGATGWRLRNNNELIALFDTKQDAQDGMLVFKHFNRHCYLGRGYTGSDRLKYIYEWFASV